jgi:hypothetical protein
MEAASNGMKLSLPVIPAPQCMYAGGMNNPIEPSRLNRVIIKTPLHF